MRYRKGSIALSGTRDYPLLRQVLHSGFITHTQLFELLRLDSCVSSRNVFNNRVLRLVNHRLLVRHDLPLTNRESVYSISEAGASELVSKGECYVRTDRPTFGNGRSHLNHALDLNEIHLALKRTGTLVYWTPETEIRSRNDLTANGYWKYYDAVVVVRLGQAQLQRRSLLWSVQRLPSGNVGAASEKNRVSCVSTSGLCTDTGETIATYWHPFSWHCRVIAVSLKCV